MRRLEDVWDKVVTTLMTLGWVVLALIALYVLFKYMTIAYGSSYPVD